MRNNTHSTDISRRRFLTVAGGAAGLAAMAAMGFPEECRANIPKIDLSRLTSTDHETDVLVIGSGMAGLFAAVKAHDAGARVIMVSKGRLGTSGQTPFARGFFSFDPAREKMSSDEFTAEVSRSALGTNNPVFTRQLAEHSKARARDLEQWGFFDSNRYAHSFGRPVTERNIPVMERIMLTHLIRERGRIVGAAGFSVDKVEIHTFTARSVVLCTGAGGFKPNGFPICDLTHDGSAMAYRIGARVTGKEWNDGHPGNAEHPAAVYDQWRGEFERLPSTTGVGIRHDLGMELNYAVYRQGLDGKEPPRPPRHTRDDLRNGHRENDKETARPPFPHESLAGGPRRPVGFENPGPPPAPGPEEASSRNKTGTHHPPGRRGAPVGGASAGMSIHKAEGLVPVTAEGASNIPGLYAAGDALGSHMAGGIYTQIGSSLAGSAVQGAITGEAAAKYAARVSRSAISEGVRKKIHQEILAPLKRDRGYGPAWVTRTLQGIMIPNFVLYIKKEPLMQAALAYVEELRDHHVPMLRAADLHELRLAHETANMILNAEMKLRASIMRKESRCSHFRLDYPEMDNENWNAWINIFQGDDGSMQLEKQPFDRWPA